MMRKYKKIGLMFCLLVMATGWTQAQAPILLKGKVVDVRFQPLGMVTIKVEHPEIYAVTLADGSFTLQIPAGLKDITLTISHVGKQGFTKTVEAAQFGRPLNYVLPDLDLKLTNVEVNGTRKSTAASNSSITFDREAIEQTQALSIANVLNYLPGQTILKPTVSIQGNQILNLRSATNAATLQGVKGSAAATVQEQQLNEAFGLSIQVDGNALNNNSNMQASNPGFMGLNSANNVQHPENGVIQDRGQRNGTLYSSYGAAGANTGFDLRQVSAENIESMEVISGVASARYGDYTSGVIDIKRQAGITPLRMNLRNNGASQNVGINKGFRISPTWGTVNLSLDYLNSNDDPRDKLKAYERIGGGLLWTYQNKGRTRFKNTLSVDYGTTIDQTRRDPDLDNMRLSRFKNIDLRLSNRSEWTIKKPWLYKVRMEASYNRSKQLSYDQWYINSTGVIGIADAMQTGTYEGYFSPGYYLAKREIDGEPITAAARLETNSIFRFAKNGSYTLTLGANYSYSANKGEGVILDETAPRFRNQGSKNDRSRSLSTAPALNNGGIYIENVLSTKLFGKSISGNIGARGDIQNSFFTFSPRININYRLSKSIAWKIAYGVATKAPGLSQISPGDVYFDIPLLSIYNAQQQLYLVHTEVVQLDHIDLKPYRSNTFETGFTFDTKPIHGSLYYFNRINKDGFTSTTTIYPVLLPDYTYTLQAPGQPVLYAPSGTSTRYAPTYNLMANGNYSTTHGMELMLATNKIKAMQTNFTFNTSYYHTWYKNTTPEVNLGTDGQTTIDTSKTAIYGVFTNQESSATNIKSALTTSTHIPALRMAIMLTGEIFWVSKAVTMASGIYPTGYLDKNGNYSPLSQEQARSAEYAHLVKKAAADAVAYTPAIVYSNIHLRMSKEISDVLRVSFNAYNVFNIRPKVTDELGSMIYYNGQPAYGAELIFTIR